MSTSLRDVGVSDLPPAGGSASGAEPAPAGVVPGPVGRRVPAARFALAVSFLWLLVTTEVFGAPQAHLPWSARLAVVAALTVPCCWIGPARIAPVVAGLAWLCFDKFVEGRYGQLYWHGAHDGTAIAVLVGVALLTVAVRALAGSLRRFPQALRARGFPCR